MHQGEIDVFARVAARAARNGLERVLAMHRAAGKQIRHHAGHTQQQAGAARHEHRCYFGLARAVLALRDIERALDGARQQPVEAQAGQIRPSRVEHAAQTLSAEGVADQPRREVVQLGDLHARLAAGEPHLGFLHRVQQHGAHIGHVLVGELLALLQLGEHPLVHERPADLLARAAEHVARPRVSGRQIAHLHHRHIQRAAAEVEHHVHLALAHVGIVAEDAGGGLVEHAHRAAEGLQDGSLQPVHVLIEGLHRQRDHEVLVRLQPGREQHLADQVVGRLARRDQVAVDTAGAVVVAQDVELDPAKGAAVAGKPGILHLRAGAERIAFPVVHERGNDGGFPLIRGARHAVAIGLADLLEAQRVHTPRGGIPACEHRVAGAEVDGHGHGAVPCILLRTIASDHALLRPVRNAVPRPRPPLCG